MIWQKGYTPTQQFNSDQCSSDITFKTFSIALSYLYFCSGEITCSMGSIIPVLRCPTKRRTYWSVMVGWITYSLQFRHMKFADTWLTLSDRNWTNKIHLHLATYTATDRQTDTCIQRHSWLAVNTTSCHIGPRRDLQLTRFECISANITLDLFSCWLSSPSTQCLLLSMHRARSIGTPLL